MFFTMLGVRLDFEKTVHFKIVKKKIKNLFLNHIFSEPYFFQILT